MAKSLPCPWCGRPLATDFLGLRFTRKCKCGVEVTVIIPQDIFDKERAKST